MNFAHGFDTHVLVDKYRKKKRQIKDGVIYKEKNGWAKVWRR